VQSHGELTLKSIRQTKHLESKSANIFARKSLTFRENTNLKTITKLDKTQPEDYQIQHKGEDSMISVAEEPTVSNDESAAGDISDKFENDYYKNSPETLLTQIGIEETNIKTIGVSGTKPKVQSGSLTERQS